MNLPASCTSAFAAGFNLSEVDSAEVELFIELPAIELGLERTNPGEHPSFLGVAVIPSSKPEVNATFGNERGVPAPRCSWGIAVDDRKRINSYIGFDLTCRRVEPSLDGSSFGSCSHACSGQNEARVVLDSLNDIDRLVGLDVRFVVCHNDFFLRCIHTSIVFYKR